MSARALASSSGIGTSASSWVEKYSVPVTCRRRPTCDSVSLVSLKSPRPIRRASRAVVWPTYLQWRCRWRLRDSSTTERTLVPAGWTGGAGAGMFDRSKMGWCTCCECWGAGGGVEACDDVAVLLLGDDSFLLLSSTFRFRGCAFSTKVQSCLWNSQRTQRRSSWRTHLLLRRRQPSQGRSRRGR